MPGVVVRGEFQEREVYEHRGIQCRRETYDSYVVNEIQRSYGMLDVKDKVVFDIGANIGAFTVWADKHGAKFTCAFEPEPYNFEMLMLNILKLESNQALHNVALTTGDDKDAELWLAPSGKNPGNSSLTQRRGRSFIKIKTMNFYSVLEEYKPEVIKMDVEGAEFDLLEYGLPDYIKQIAMEINLNDRDLFDGAPGLLAQFKDWKCIKEPVLNNDKLWQTLGAWKR